MSLVSEVFTAEKDDHVATLWLDRPEKRNAMGTAFWNDLPRLVEELDADPEVRCILLAARGKAFTVGLDLVEFGGILGDGSGTKSQAQRAQSLHREVRRLQASISCLEQTDKPVIAAIHGWCIGGGIDLITAADIRLASSDAVFSVRETKIAIVADVGTLQRLPRIVGPGHAAELVYTGKDFDAAEAERVGLINRVYDSAETLLSEARQMAADIAANAPLTVQGAKHVMRRGRDMSVEDSLEYVAVWNSANLRSNDLNEAMAAFLERRPPNFSGS
jgi:enoyl-CoA hydratase